MKRSKSTRTDEQYFAGAIFTDKKTSEIRIHSTCEPLNSAIEDWKKCKEELARIKERDRFVEDVKAADNAPINKVTLVFTDIENSTALWELDATTMALCLLQHNSLMRGTMTEFNGYEVKTEGDAFMSAFKESFDAVRFCLSIQTRLMRLDWPNEFLTSLAPDVFDDQGVRIFTGVRVRMGIHTGFPICQRDPNTGRMDYFGRMVNKAARIGGLARAGQVLVSDAVMDEVARHMSQSMAQVTALGRKVLKGIKEEISCFELVPRHLSGRTAHFAKTRDQPAISLQKMPSAMPRFVNQTAPVQLNKLLAAQQSMHGRSMGRSLTERDFEASQFLGKVAMPYGGGIVIPGADQDPELMHDAAFKSLKAKYDAAMKKLESLTAAQSPVRMFGELDSLSRPGSPSPVEVRCSTASPLHASSPAFNAKLQELATLKLEKAELTTKLEALEGARALADRTLEKLHSTERELAWATKKIARLEAAKFPAVPGGRRENPNKKNALWETHFASEYWITKSCKTKKASDSL
eukprot:TRINITY_DN396_c0_g1_i1.p1 TRINITY_DN396_c0_g1~~TRINITY_DN396_c0_g1_i1.p1  ORF type:complete len:521 (-),score=148.58 TRINITY_DN396_c0_g1_i1:563-2125(-)